MLLALCIANNWPTCTAQEDCHNIGMACIHFLDGAVYSPRPYCMDCNYLVDAPTGFGSVSEPWSHRMVVADGITADNPIASASSHCVDMLLAPQHRHYFEGRAAFFPENWAVGEPSSSVHVHARTHACTRTYMHACR